MTLIIPISSSAKTVESPITSFVKRRLRVVLTLGNQITYQGTNANTLTLEGMRIIFNGKYAGAIAPEAQVRIYGMRQEDMNSLTMLSWKKLNVSRNTIQVFALDAGSWYEVFHGDLLDCVPDYDEAPEVCLRVSAISLLFDKYVEAAPTSYKGSVAAADIIDKLATSINYTFENHGVTAQLTNQYLDGTVVDQIKSVAKAADCDLFIDGSCVTITARDRARELTPIVVSPSSGLVSYPTIDNQGIRCRSLWIPGLRIGSPITITSDVPKANGDWRIYSLTLTLESERPDGQWFADIGANEYTRSVLSMDVG